MPNAPSAKASDAAMIKRQAVVVVHGQGEQRPMGTIRSFVETLWTFDFGLKLDDPGLNDPEKGNRTWIVPDEKGGLFDVQRITSPALKLDGRRTDFFELYYADLFNTTPFRTLTRWLQRLIWVDPRHVTSTMRVPWGTFWLLSILAVLLFGFASYQTLQLPPDLLMRVYADPWFTPSMALIAIMGLILVLPRMMLLLPSGMVDAIAAVRDRHQFALANVPAWVAYMGVVAAATMLLHSYLAFWLFLILAVELYLANALLLPYFGDAASYLSAHTETVDIRQQVRQRGLALLRGLHADNDYDRVVVVAHSLGTVLAYDLLHILWEEVGPTKDNLPEQGARDALQALDAYVTAHPQPEWTDKQIAGYQDRQWVLFDQLRRQKGVEADKREAGWKISDFVTMGSPLTSAQFLVAEGPADFAGLKDDRLMPTSPAQPYDDDHQAAYLDGKQRLVAHHGAVFSAVRWTNLYDPFPRIFLYGDAIGGKISGPDRFGAGIVDQCRKIYRFERVVEEELPDGTVRTHREYPLPWLTRVFTHNHYWTNTNGNWKIPSAHIEDLRLAVGIDRQVPPGDPVNKNAAPKGGAE